MKEHTIQPLAIGLAVIGKCSGQTNSELYSRVQIAVITVITGPECAHWPMYWPNPAELKPL